MEILCVILLIAFIIDRRSIIKLFNIMNQEQQIEGENAVSCWKQWILPRPDITASCGTAKSKSDMELANGMHLKNGELIKTTNLGNTLMLKDKIIAALTNPYNYLFALVHSCLCIPQAILGALWLKPYVEAKFGLNETIACEIAAFSNVGAAISSFIIGYIGKKLQTKRQYVYRELICIGFLLWSTCLLMIYVDAKYHNHWTLFLLAGISGSGMGSITIVFAGIRMVNDEAKCADVASGLVSTICMGVMWISYQGTGYLFKLLSVGNQDTTEVYNKVFYYVAASILIGFCASFLVPKNYK